MYAPRTPKACPCPAIATVIPLTTPWSAKSDEPRKRVSAGRFSKATASPAVSVKPDSVCESAGMTDLPDTPVLPADPRPQQQEFAARLQFQHVAELHLQRLSDQHDGLVQQRRDIVAHHRELAESCHDGLLEGTVEEDFFGLLTLVDAFFQRGRHGIESVCQLAQFAPLGR